MNFSKTIIWEALAWKGREQCRIEFIDNHYHVNSVLKGKIGSQPFDLTYQLKISPIWQVVSVQIDSLSDNRRLVEFHKDAKGIWSDSQSHPLNEFSQCIDIDISLSPFTNTLPIRRLTFEPNQKQAISVIYIDLPTGSLKPLKQWYTKLENRRYKYEDENGYMYILTVDENDFVIDYPTVFSRR
ncbi:MAG: putative glycolipid-binding domain-containing protein [Candidatus Levyibacteriota bacterium]